MCSHEMTDFEQLEWPIYKLANYDNAGQLLELCRANLMQPQQLERHAHDTNSTKKTLTNETIKHQNNIDCTTTSGYRTITTEESLRCSNRAIQSHPNTSLQLEWRHLIQVEAPGVNREFDLELERLYRARLVRLCAQIKRLLRSSVQLERLEASSATDRTFRELESEGNSRHQAQATPEAQLRRSSWRKRHLQQLGQLNESSADEKLVKRHLAAAAGESRLRNQTFSLTRSNEKSTYFQRAKDSVEESAKEEKFYHKTRIERWLKSNTSNRVLLGGYDKLFGRGRYGESIVHILLIQHSNEHLILLVLILHLWPQLMFDAFQSDKFKHLNCLHLTISHQNADLLEYLIKQMRHSNPQEASRVIEQRVSGSLFRPPLKEMQSASKIPQDGETNKFWCDKLEHWPTANGARHLILLDRFRAAAAAAAAAGDKSVQLERAIYFGQTPLAWALSFKSRQMFELLVSETQGGSASVNSSVDFAGNTCLHQLVLNNQTGWTRFLIRHKVNLNARNSMGLTPFLLACHLGRCELFVEFLELSAVEFWCYSSVRCCGYPLTNLDSLISAKEDDRRKQAISQSAVAIILESRHSTNEEKSALLSTNVVKKLLEEKWQIFARRLFYRDLAKLLLQLALMLVASLLRPARVLQEAQNNHTQAQLEITGRKFSESQWRQFAIDWLATSDKQTLVRHTCELAIASIALENLWNFGSEWARYRNLKLQLTYNPLAANAALANALVLACLPLRLIGLCLQTSATSTKVLNADSLRLRLDQLEDVLLIVASPLLWSSLLFFVAAFYVTGPFVAMINYMLMRDLRQFSLIYLIFLYAFAQCIFFVNQQQAAFGLASSNHNSTTNNLLEQNLESGEQSLELLLDWLAQLATKYVELWLELFKMTLGVYEFQPFRNSILSRLLLTLFMHLIPILFNMLIAMMNNTYSLIISQSERAWSFQWAKTLFALERRLNEDQRLFYLKKYAINLSSSIKKDTAELDGDGDNCEPAQDVNKKGEAEVEQFVPGLMIIKRSHCTRAEMRRKLIGHWQKSIRQVLDKLKETK